MSTLHKKRMFVTKAAGSFLIALSLSLSVIPVAYAQVTTVEGPGPLLSATLLATKAAGATTFSTAATAGSTGGSLVITKVINAAVWAVAKAAIQAITRSIVVWINSGYKGSPAFATNINASLLKVSDQEAALFIKELSSTAGIKSPFSDQLIANTSSNYYLNSSSAGFANRIKFTLGQPGTTGSSTIATNPAAFLAGDFTQGGFSAMFSSITNPANNPFGAQYIVNDELTKRINNGNANQLKELDWAKGFLSWRGSCGASGQADSGAANGKACKTDDDCAGSLACNVTTHTCAVDTQLDTPVTLSSTDTCLGYNIQTPGSVIESQLENVLGSPIRQLELANSINEIIGAAATQLVSQVLGPGGLLGSSAPGAGGTPSALATATNPAAYTGSASSLSTGLTQSLTDQNTQLTQYQTGWQALSSVATKAKATLTTAGTCPAKIQTVVQPVIDKATTALKNAATDLASLASIQAEATAVTTAAPTDQVTLFQKMSTDYQAFISSPLVPSPTDIANVVAQSTDTGSSTPASLYTQLSNIALQGCSAAGS